MPKISTIICARNYDPPIEKSTDKETPSSQPDGSLHIEKPPLDIVTRAPKAILHKTTHNPKARASQHYSIIKDLA